ncbi:MAG: glutamyl-tRNA reductase [Ardenticatenia bacterium]|nr:glutamyl-tRNA reductase [Ardenticatenia bacterium]
MQLVLFGTDHRRTPVAVREHLARAVHDEERVLTTLVASPDVAEAVVLSTCNRIEFYMVGSEASLLLDTLQRLLVREGGVLSLDELSDHLVCARGEEVVGHLFRVASGLESLVPGEKQVLGQVRAAIQAARRAHAVGPVLNRLFDHAIACGRRVRAETGIDRHPVSISHAAVHLAREHFGRLDGRAFLIIGSGKMGTIAAGLLQKAGVCHFSIASRTLAHACELARRWGARPLTLRHIPAALAEVDAVISATAAPHYILRREALDATLRGRTRPLLLIDLAVPRDIDPALGELPGVTLVDVDGLHAVVERNLALRHGTREAAERLIAEEVDAFRAWLAARRVAPTIAALRDRAEAIRQAELERALRRLEHLSPQEREIIAAFSRRLINRLLHEPTVRLRAEAARGSGELYRHALEELFNLYDDLQAERDIARRAAP